MANGWDRDPEQWSGEIGVESGKLRLGRWRPNVLNTTTAGHINARISDDEFANEQLRPETERRRKHEPSARQRK